MFGFPSTLFVYFCLSLKSAAHLELVTLEGNLVNRDRKNHLSQSHWAWRGGKEAVATNQTDCLPKWPNPDTPHTVFHFLSVWKLQEGLSRQTLTTLILYSLPLLLNAAMT